MTASHDLDRMVQAYLVDGPTELPDPSFDAVRDRTESTRQRVVLGPWRFPEMNKLVPIAAGGAVIAAVVLGAQLLQPAAPSGPGGVLPASPTPTLAPSVTVAPSATAAPTPSPAADVPLGRLLWIETTPSITVTIPAAGWINPPDFDALMKGDTEDPPEAAMIAGSLAGGAYVYGDPCQWASTTPDEPATAVDDVVAALAAQPGRDASDPVDVTIDGYQGKHITLHVPASDDPRDEAFAACSEGEYASWAIGASNSSPDRWHQGPGQIDELWFLEVEGELVVIDVMYRPGTPAALIEEMHAIVESATFE
jgi:hypothetical protein